MCAHVHPHMFTVCTYINHFRSQKLLKPQNKQTDRQHAFFLLQVAVAILIPSEVLDGLLLPHALPKWGVWGTGKVSYERLLKFYARNAFENSSCAWMTDGVCGCWCLSLSLSVCLSNVFCAHSPSSLFFIAQFQCTETNMATDLPCFLAQVCIQVNHHPHTPIKSHDAPLLHTYAPEQLMPSSMLLSLELP